MIEVVGIDTNSYGYHAVGLADSWHAQAPRSMDPRERRAFAFSNALSLFASLPDGSAVFIEEPIVLLKNIVTTRQLVMMAGVIECAFFTANPDATVFWVNISTWKKATIGNGNASKEQIRRHYIDRGVEYDVQDFYDARAIMEYGARQVAT